MQLKFDICTATCAELCTSHPSLNPSPGRLDQARLSNALRNRPDIERAAKQLSNMDNNTRLQVPEGANNDTRLAQPLSNDPIQLNLDAVNQQLVKPSFLKALSPSRLPSQAASDTSLSPGDAPLEARSPGLHHTHSRLNLVNTAGLEELRLETILDEIPADVDLTAPLTLEPTNPDGEDTAATTNINVDAHISEHLDSRFVDAYRAYTTMASGAIQTFSHGHQDLVLAVDFNYFGTRMVSASSDQRLKVYDKKDDGWTLVESWRAHDAEIVDVSTTHFCVFLLSGSNLSAPALICRAC